MGTFSCWCGSLKASREDAQAASQTPAGLKSLLGCNGVFTLSVRRDGSRLPAPCGGAGAAMVRPAVTEERGVTLN